METVLIVFVLAVPAYVVHRLSKVGAQSIFNFSLYPLVFAYFYLLIPALIPFTTALDTSLSLSSSSFEVVDQLSAWSVLVFFIGYVFSKDMKGHFNNHLEFSKLSLSMAKFIQGIVVLVMFFILFKHGPSLFALAGDRGLSYEYYAREIIDAYKLPVLWSFAVISSSLLYFNYRRWIFLTPLLAFAVLDALQGGRGYTFAAASVIGLNYLALNMDKFKRTVICLFLVAFLIFASAFVRRFLIVDDTSDPLVIFFGEFFFTRLTAQITYDNLSASGDLMTYLLLAVSKMFPQFIVSPLFNQSDLVPYHVRVNDWADAGFGLAGSVMSEALYYGGVEFAVVSPLLISGIFLILSRVLWVRSLAGYLFFLVMVSSMYLIFRTGFYTIFFSSIYMFLFYFSIIIYPSIRRRIFI